MRAGRSTFSRKGLDAFRTLGPKRGAYIDILGSGVETFAPGRENTRIALMFCAFQGSPKILRLHGLGRIVEPHEEGFVPLQSHFPVHERTRAMILVEVTRISDSCGYGVPLLKFERERAELPAWCRKRGTEGLKIYRRGKTDRVWMDCRA